MQLICTEKSVAVLPKQYVEIGFGPTYEFDLTVGKAYLVLGLRYSMGCLMCLTSNDYDLPEWFPIDLFRVVDGTFPESWSMAIRDYAALTVVIGYDALVSDTMHHDALIEREPSALRVYFAEHFVEKQHAEQRAR